MDTRAAPPSTPGSSKGLPCPRAEGRQRCGGREAELCLLNNRGHKEFRHSGGGHHHVAPMLRVAGSERDDQLWVSSGKEEAPCPLVGREYPYGIPMSPLRDTALLTQGPEDPASPSHLPEPFLMGQLPGQMWCQFTLSPAVWLPPSSSVTQVRRHLKGEGLESGPLGGVLALTWVTCPCHQPLLCQDSPLECLWPVSVGMTICPNLSGTCFSVSV